MHKDIRARYHDGILDDASRRFGIRRDTIRRLDAFENVVYIATSASGEFILRLGHSLRRTELLVRAELHWLNYLADNGASVPRALVSTRGELVETIQDGSGGAFFAVMFTRAPGRRPTKAGWTREVFERYGELLGLIHALSTRFLLHEPACKRMDWRDHLVSNVEERAPLLGEAVIDAYSALRDEAERLPRGPSCYGLIHYDAHPANLVIDDTGRLTLIDFDDAAYGWFVQDIAIVLFHMAMTAETPADAVQAFLTPFLRGYRRHHTLEGEWLARIPLFLRLREVEMLAVLQSHGHVIDAAHHRLVEECQRRIELGIPLVAYDFASLAAC
jgi:amicoumacin kinase